MQNANGDNTKLRKRPPVTGTLVGVRLQPAQLDKIDVWASEQSDKPSRPEAVRRLVEKALDTSGDR